VFDGRKGAYVETDLPDAQDLYGRSKALGETTMNEPAALTLRTSFVGRELTAPKHGLVEWFLSQAGGRVRGFAGVVYTGLTSRELARVVELLVDSDPGLAGVYHVASAPITKLELLELIRAVYELDIDIEEVAEPRSDRSLVMGPFTQATGYQAPAWDQMVLDMYHDPTPYDDLARKAEVIERE
jgi:dTDP-4-dehydrorhamnose reductase